MKFLALAFLVLWTPGLSGIQQDDAFAVRTVEVSVADGEGAPVSGLEAESFSLVERGIERDIVEVTADDRQAEILLLVDTSVAFYAEVQPLRQAVDTFIRAVTPNHVMSLYEFGGRPNLMAGPSDDAGPLLSAVGKLYARQQDASYLLDAIVETADEIDETEREADNPITVVIVTGMGTEYSNNNYQRARELGARSGAVYHVVVFDSRTARLDYIRRSEIEGTLTYLADETGGTYSRVLASTGIRGKLDQVAGLLGPRYQISFLSEISPKSDLKEISVSVQDEMARVELIRLQPGEKKVPATK
jgi:VWFA-related protein